MLITAPWWLHAEVLGLAATLGSGIIYLIYQQGQRDIKIDTMWLWFTNHGSNITGYKKPEKKYKWR